MGWSTVTMLKRYQYVIDTLRRDAAHRMGEFLYGPTTAATHDTSTGDGRADRRRQDRN